MEKEYTQSAETLLRQLHTDENGLSTGEAQKRMAEHGPNKLKTAEKPSMLSRFFKQLKDPMLIILMAAAVISGVTSALSHEGFADVIIILVVVLLNAVLGVFQESKAEAAIEALQTMTAATCKVLRDGKHTILHSDELVPGDIVLLEAGDSVPADGRILEAASLKIEEAALTGESVPVNKAVAVLGLASNGGDVPLGDRKNMCYMGSTVVYGRGKILVTRTGMDTEMGKIAGALAEAKDEQTPLQRRLDELGRMLSKLVLAICVFIFVFDLIAAGEFTLKSVLSTFMVAVSLAVAAIPEGLATVVTVVLSIGVTNMSKRQAIIRRLTAVETLGCTNVICSDKTGTLTQNRMTVVQHTGETETLATAMALCNDAVDEAQHSLDFLVRRHDCLVHGIVVHLAGACLDHDHLVHGCGDRQLQVRDLALCLGGLTLEPRDQENAHAGADQGDGCVDDRGDVDGVHPFASSLLRVSPDGSGSGLPSASSLWRFRLIFSPRLLPAYVIR